MIFNIHPDQGDRLSYGVALLLNMTMYMIFISDKLPEKSDKIPFVGTLFVTFFFFLSAGLILSAYTMWCSSRTTPLPAVAHKIEKFVTKVMSICRGGTCRKNKDGSGSRVQQYRVEYGSTTSSPGLEDTENHNITSASINTDNIELVKKEPASNGHADHSSKPSTVTSFKNSVTSMMASTAVASKKFHNDSLLTEADDGNSLTTDPISYRFEDWFQFMRFIEKCLTVLFALLLIIIPLVIAASLDTSRKR